MQLLNRFLVWLTAAVALAGFELALRQPRQTYWRVAGSVILLFLTLWQLTGRHLAQANFWRFAVTPVLFLLSGWLFFIFSEATRWRHFYALILAGFILVFFHAVYIYWHQRPRYQAHSLENMANYLNVLTVFLGFVGLFNLKIFLNFNFWGLLVVGAAGAVLLTYQLLSLSGLSLKQSGPALLVTAILLGELFGAVNFLPTSAYVNGLIIALFYYILTGLVRNWLLQIQERQVVIRYLFISVFTLIVILFSAKWF